MARRKWLVFAALFLAVIVFVAQCVRAPQRNVLSSTFGKAPQSASDVPTSRTSSGKQTRRGADEALDDRAFHPVAVSLRTDGEGPKVEKTANGFLVSFGGDGPGAWPTAPAIYDGMLFFGGTGGAQQSRFYALDARTGVSRWSVDLADPGVFAPACDDGVCAFTTESCSLYVLDARTGDARWAKWLAGSLQTPPAIASGQVFATYPRFGGDIRLPARPTATQLRKYEAKMAATQHGVLAVFDLRTGKTAWQRWLDDAASPPLVDGGRVQVASGKTVVTFTTTGGELVSTHSADWHEFGVSLPTGRDILWSRTSLESVDAKNGGDLWTIPVDRPTEPILVGDSIIVGTGDGQLLKIDSVAGDVIRRWSAGSAVLAPPIADGGWIYATTQKGVIAIETGDASITGWAQWGGNAQRSLASIERRSARPASKDAIADMSRPDESEVLQPLIGEAPSPSPTPESWELP